MAGFIEDNRFVVLGSVAIVMVGLMGSGFLLGDGLRRAKEADREAVLAGLGAEALDPEPDHVGVLDVDAELGPEQRAELARGHRVDSVAEEGPEEHGAAQVAVARQGPRGALLDAGEDRALEALGLPGLLDRVAPRRARDHVGIRRRPPARGASARLDGLLRPQICASFEGTPARELLLLSSDLQRQETRG